MDKKGICADRIYVTGLGPDCVPGSWPELTLAALQFRQEPPFPINKSAHINWLIRFSLSLPSSINYLSSFGIICLHATRPVTIYLYHTLRKTPIKKEKKGPFLIKKEIRL